MTIQKGLKSKIKKIISVYKYEIKYLFKNKTAFSYEANVAEIFSGKEVSFEKKLDVLFDYLYEGYRHYSIDDGSRVIYPGYKSENNKERDAIEGTSRFVPYVGAYLIYINKKHKYPEKIEELKTLLQKIYLTGTDPLSSSYWGKPDDYDQLIVEMADLALGLWISKDIVWNGFNANQKQQIIEWLTLAINKKTVDNNWHLFPLLIQCVIGELTGKNIVQIDLYHRVKEFYIAEGWYKDGPNGGVDYYNAWGFHYPLFWINQINPELDSEFIRNKLIRFCSSYKYLFNSKGMFPVFGRSLCYRMAAPAPIVAASMIDDRSISKGLAKNILKKVWCHFVQNNVLENGIFTQGFYKTDEQYIDNYSGPASSLWSLRSLIIAYYVDAVDSDFFSANEEALPIEKGSYHINLKKTGISIIGSRKTDIIKLLINNEKSNLKSLSPRLIHRIGWVLYNKISLHPRRKRKLDSESGQDGYSTADAEKFLSAK